MTIIFTDLVGSTAVKAVMDGADPTERNRHFYEQILIPHRRRVVRDLLDSGGRVVKTMGDGFFLVFNQPVKALQWLVAVQRSHLEDPIHSPVGPVRMRAGMHVGKAVVDDNDLIGQDVDMAARIQDLANGNQIVISQQAVKAAGEPLPDGLTLYDHGEQPLKGIGHCRLFEVIYPGHDAQPLRRPKKEQIEKPPAPARLEAMTPDGKRLAFSLDRRTVLIGRSDVAQVQLNDEQVSTRHAELFCNASGQWSIHDLGSKSGISVNGRRVKEMPLQPGDVIMIGTICLTLTVQDAIEQDVTEGLIDSNQVKVSRHADPSVCRLNLEVPKTLKTARLGARHIKAFRQLDYDLAHADDDAGRLKLLAQMLVHEPFNTLTVFIYRLTMDQSPVQVTGLGRPTVAKKWRQYATFFSMRLLERVRKAGRPVLAYDMTGGVARQCARSLEPINVTLAAIPVHQTEQWMDVLYAVVETDSGVPSWLSLAVHAVYRYQAMDRIITGRTRQQALQVTRHELDKARELQATTRPESWDTPGVDVWFQTLDSAWAGGDYADILTLPDDRTLVLVADAEGQGTSAATVAALAHAVVRSNVSAKLSLAELMSRLNAFLCSRQVEGESLTIAALLINPTTGECQYVNAGHPPLVTMDLQGRIERLPGSSQVPLGIVPGDVPGTRLQLESGQWVHLFSDGLVGLSGRLGEQLGVDRFTELLHRERDYAAEASAQGLTRRLVDLLLHYHGDSELSDDLTLMCLRWI